jgi:hypothetical protein
VKLPVSIIDAHGEVSVYASVHEAEVEMEPIDVENGEFVVKDATGRHLTPVVVTEEMPLLWGLMRGAVKVVRIVDPLDEAGS